MPKTNQWNKSVQLVELDQRARNAHLRREADRIMTAIAIGFRLFHRILPDLAGAAPLRGGDARCHRYAGGGRTSLRAGMAGGAGPRHPARNCHPDRVDATYTMASRYQLQRQGAP